MPPRSLEQNYSTTPELDPKNPENSQEPVERYLDIERGDVNFMPQDNNGGQAQPVPSMQQQQQQSVDPVQLVQDMISAGFTPTRAQIANASGNLSGPKDSANTWFSIFLQRLLKQQKQKKKKKQ